MDIICVSLRVLSIIIFTRLVVNGVTDGSERKRTISLAFPIKFVKNDFLKITFQTVRVVSNGRLRKYLPVHIILFVAKNRLMIFR